LITLIAMMTTAFATLHFSYFYLRLYADDWPLGGLAHPDLWAPTPALLAVLASAGAQWAAYRSFRAGQPRKAGALQALALGLGLAFLGGLVTTIAQAPFAMALNAYTSLFHALEAMLAIVTLPGLVMLGATLPRLWGPDQGGAVPPQLQITTHFWLAVAAMALMNFVVVQLSPYVI
jgi:heme/copper-type cytochrome/quinol oxidase subunit 3